MKISIKTDRDLFTTGQISRMYRVSPRTVSKWIDTGILRGYRLPMSKDRRVTRTNLVAFLKQYEIPLRGLEDYDERRPS